MDLALQGRAAIVTGGSKGLGRAIAEEFVREGASVALCARNAEEVAAAAEELRSLGGSVHAQAADVTVPEQVRDFVAASVEALGGLDILVNSVNIGFVVTPQWKNVHQRLGPDLTEDEFFGRLAEAEVPLGRFGRPDEVSGIVAFLCSDRASYITGASIDVAGGMGRYL